VSAAEAARRAARASVTPPVGRGRLRRHPGAVPAVHGTTRPGPASTFRCSRATGSRRRCSKPTRWSSAGARSRGSARPSNTVRTAFLDLAAAGDQVQGAEQGFAGKSWRRRGPVYGRSREQPRGGAGQQASPPPMRTTSTASTPTAWPKCRWRARWAVRSGKPGSSWEHSDGDLANIEDQPDYETRPTPVERPRGFLREHPRASGRCWRW